MTVILRHFTVEDAAAHNAGEDEATMKWLNEGYTSTLESTVAAIQRWAQVHNGSERGEYAFAIELEGKLAGMIGINPHLDGLQPGQVNVSCAVHPWARGRCVAEAAIDAADWFVAENDLGDWLIIRVNPDNTASVRVAEKAGFSYDGVHIETDGTALAQYRRHVG